MLRIVALLGLGLLLVVYPLLDLMQDRMLFLRATQQATLGGRVGLEPLGVHLRPAIDADAIAPGGQALLCPTGRAMTSQAAFGY